MSSHELDQTGDSKKFTLTAILAFVAVFAFMLLISLWHGPFKPGAQAEPAEHAVEK